MAEAQRRSERDYAGNLGRRLDCRGQREHGSHRVAHQNDPRNLTPKPLTRHGDVLHPITPAYAAQLAVVCSVPAQKRRLDVDAQPL